MVDKNLYRSAEAKVGLISKVVADKLGITPAALSRKVNNQSDFKLSEIQKLVEILELTPEETMLIFFTK